MAAPSIPPHRALVTQGKQPTQTRTTLREAQQVLYAIKTDLEQSGLLPACCVVDVFSRPVGDKLDRYGVVVHYPSGSTQQYEPELVVLEVAIAFPSDTLSLFAPAIGRLDAAIGSISSKSLLRIAKEWLAAYGEQMPYHT